MIKASYSDELSCVADYWKPKKGNADGTIDASRH
jgi:hypothetical protein